MPFEPSCQESQACHLVHRPEVRASLSFQVATRHFGAVRAHDRDPAPPLERTHRLLDVRREAIPSTSLVGSSPMSGMYRPANPISSDDR